MSDKCEHCDLELKPCPFCGKPAKIYGSNMVGCIDTVNCNGGMDFGHWDGTSNGVPAVHWVIIQWNKRTSE